MSLIPTTLARTTLGAKGPGASVNLEVDVIAKYVEATNEHAPFLMRKADRIEEYLQQR